MKVLFDHQIFSSQRFGGVSRYHAELFREFDRCGDPAWSLPLFFSNNAYLAELRPVRRFFPTHPFRGRERLLERLNRFRVTAALRRGNFDIFHPTFYDSYFVGLLGAKPMVLTVHDMIHDEHPELPAASWEIREKSRSVAAARLIITPSQATADALIRLYGVAASRVRVIRHGAPPLRTGAVPPLNAGEFIFVGGRGFYKNFDVVLRALALRPEYRLLCVGSAFSPPELARQQELGVAAQVRRIALFGNEELADAYAASAGLIFSSENEGFGLPVLESFAAGCPALLADIPVFREVAGDAAVYFAPNSPEALAAGMDELAARRDEWVAAGLVRGGLFNWQKCAAETAAVYREVLR